MMAVRSSRLFLFLGVLLLGALQVQAEPLLLSDDALDRLTAGTVEQEGAGGVIIGNSSEAVMNETRGVELSDDVQSGAMGLNIVNSAGSAVANAINVWDGGGATSTPLNVEQINHVEQDQQRSASISHYSRSEADRRVRADRSLTESHESHSNALTSTTDLHITNHLSNKDSSSNVNTRIVATIGNPDNALGQFHLEANVGQGIAVAGQIDVHFDGGEAEFMMAAGGGITAGADINVGPFFGAGVEVSAEADFSLFLDIELPEMDVQINGAGCGVVMGSCSASGSSFETSEEIIDNSSLHTLVENSVSNNQYSEVITEEYRSPFDLGNARAEYIVVDNSSLVVNTNYSLVLTGSAQSNVRAMNVVNAIGSAVTNAVNVSRNTVGGNEQLVINQSNRITHGR